MANEAVLRSLLPVSKTDTTGDRFNLDEQFNHSFLLCKGKDDEVVEYALRRNLSPTLIPDYKTKLIDKKILRDKLHQLFEALEE